MAGRFGYYNYSEDEKRESDVSSLLGSFDENDNYGTNSGRRFSIVPPEGNRPFSYSEVDVADLEDFDPMGERKKTSCIGNECKKIKEKIKKAVKSIKKKLSKKKGGRRTRKRKKIKRTRKRKKKRRRRRRSRK
tara:strand:- start:5498 stop:5896 length:399 start_codon:yes stop_codon:yes gene_type:complete